MRFLREVASFPTLMVALLCLVVSVPATILLTPDQHTTVAGQQIAVGARVPNLSWTGPAQLVQIGNTQLDVPPLDISGPLRPRIVLGPVARNEAAVAALDPANGNARENAETQITSAFTRWYSWAAVILVAITIGLVALAACLRMLITMRRESRRALRGHRAGSPPRADETMLHPAVTVHQLWQRSRTQVRAMIATALVATLAAWAGSGVLAYTGVASGLKNVRSLTDLVGSFYIAPAPVGPLVEGYTGAVIGDSRAARLGGPLAPDASEEDRACSRSSDSLAGQVSSLTAVPMLNLACSGATIVKGLRGTQQVGDTQIAAQVGKLRQLAGLQFVVVVIGPNDLGWSDQLRYCYGVQDCRDRLTDGEFAYRLGAFDSAYGDLLHDLNDLPGAPQVIVVTSYDVFTPEPTCPDAQGPPGAAGLSAANAELLAARNHRLNNVLVAGAQKYNFSIAHPVLTPLCAAPSDSLGPDLQGLADAAPFHPTGVGELRMASSVVQVLNPR